MNDSAKGSIAVTKPAPPSEPDVIDQLRHRYSGSPYQFAGMENAHWLKTGSRICKGIGKVKPSPVR